MFKNLSYGTKIGKDEKKYKVHFFFAIFYK